MTSHVTFLDEEHGPLWVYELPEPGEDYVIGIDTQEGKERDRRTANRPQISGARSPDYNAMSVTRVSDGVEVATYLSNYAPFLLAEDAISLGVYYGPGSGCGNFAFLVPEINGPGVAVIEKLRERGYPRIFITRSWLSMEQAWQKTVGWRTTEQSRAVMVGDLQREVHTGECGVTCIRTANHMSSMRYNANGKPEAPAGAHDDLAFARMMAMQGRIHCLRAAGDHEASSGDDGERPHPDRRQAARDAEFAESCYQGIESSDREPEAWEEYE